MLLALLLFARSALALPTDCASERVRNIAGIAASQSARYTVYKASNCGGNIRAVNWGHSISIGMECDARVNDGYRRELTPILADKGRFIKWIGLQYPGATSVLECPGASLPGVAPTIQMVYTDITTNARTRFDTPTANDWAFIGPTLTNDAAVGTSLADMQARLVASITQVAEVIPSGKIFISNDIARTDGVSLTNALAAANYAFTYTRALGHNVYFLDVNSCSVELCGDKLHPTVAGQDSLASCMSQLILNALGQ